MLLKEADQCSDAWNIDAEYMGSLNQQKSAGQDLVLAVGFAFNANSLFVANW